MLLGLGISLIRPPSGGGGAPAASQITDILPEEMVAMSFYQEDLPTGAVASWQSGGANPVAATQASGALQPTKQANNGGVLFAQGTKQCLTWATSNGSPYQNRWWVAIARCSAGALTAGQAVNVFCVNGPSTANTARQPRVIFGPSTMQSTLYDGAAKNISVACDTDGAEWNILVGMRRGFQHRAGVNGTDGTPLTLLGLRPNNGADLSFMGDPVTNLLQDIAIDCIIIGQSELTDAQFDKVMGWAAWRVGRQDILPVDHPYKSAAPTGVEDPTRYAYDETAWDAWVAETNTIRFTNRGGTPPAITGYSTVLFDDFVTNTVVHDLTGTEGNVWFAPTHLDGIGVHATAEQVTFAPPVYVHDAVNDTLALRLLHSGGNWRTGAFSSVNKNGQGRTWKKGIFEIRVKFPALAAPRPGFFPAFWAYGIEHLFWRTRNRLESDYFEYDGLDGSFINWSQHVHDPQVVFPDPEILMVDTNKKVAGYSVGAATGFPGTINIYDGNYHTFYVQIEDDFTYLVLDDLEVARCPTIPELAIEKYLMIDWAYDTAKGGVAADTGQTYDMTIDYIRVRQKETDLATVPTGFSARPTLSGVTQIDETLTLTPNTVGDQFTYYWYRDGVPIVSATNSLTYVLTADDVGHRIRAYVKNFNLTDRPEAWTAETAIVTEVPPAVIDGTGTIGQPLWATGTAPFQWQRDGVDIVGATEQSYTVQAADDLTDITCIDASGAPSNAIEGTWVRIRQNGTPALLDIDRENDRYWFNGQRYTRAEFQALTWVPDDITALVSTTAWTTGTEPFPGYDQAAGAMMITAEGTDNNVDHNVVVFSDNTTNEQYSVSIRWSQATVVARALLVDGGVNQATLTDPNTDTWAVSTPGTLAFKYKANDCWFLGKSGRFTFDNAATMPTVNRMRFGSNATGATLATATVHRFTYFAGDVPPSDIEILRGLDMATLFYGLSENDAIESRDIFGDGFPAILNSRTTGVVTLYRQQERGVFTPIVVSSTADMVEVESVAMVDHDGDGVYSIFVGDQDPGRIYISDRVTDYNTWSARTLIRDNRQWLQDMIPITFAGDDRESIVYSWEGNANGTGGINKLRWNDTTWDDTPLVQRDGAYGISLHRFANGDLLYSARDASNPGADPGIFRLTLAGVESTIVSSVNTDWKQVSIGDFFGNGNEDILANIGGTGIGGVIQQKFCLFDAANSYAQTDVNIGKDLNFGCQNAGFQVNGRDVVLVAGDGYVEMWAWDGVSAWTLYRSLQNVGATLKFDDRPARMNIFRQLPGNDFVWGDSFGFKIRAVRSVP